MKTFREFCMEACIQEGNVVLDTDGPLETLRTVLGMFESFSITRE